MARELATEFNVDRRTIQRDLGDLREAGFILNEKRRADQRIYYQLQKDTELPQNFPIMEVAAMIFAEQAGMGLVGTPFGEHLRVGDSQANPSHAPGDAAIPRASCGGLCAAGARAQAV